MILAQTFVSAPFFIRAARTGIAGVDRDLEDAARVDGGSERQVFRLVTIPLAGAALAAGLVLSWARSLGEFGATIMFAGNVEGRTQTLPLVVYGEFQGGNLDASIAAAAILVLAALAVLLARGCSCGDGCSTCAGPDERLDRHARGDRRRQPAGAASSTSSTSPASRARVASSTMIVSVTTGRIPSAWTSGASAASTVSSTNTSTRSA